MALDAHAHREEGARVDEAEAVRAAALTPEDVDGCCVVLARLVVVLQRQLPVKSRTIVRVLAASSQVQFEVTQVNFFLADVFFCLTVVKVWDNVGLF